MTWKNSLPSNEEQNLRRVFAFQDRFAPILSRFLRRELGVEATVSLLSVENNSGCVSSLPDRVLFSANDSRSIAALSLPRSFMLGVIDRSLGNGTFIPSDSAAFWSDLDEGLSTPFVSRLLEILLGYCGTPPASELDFSVHPTEDFSLPHGWYSVQWNIDCGGNSFVFTFYIPASAAFGKNPTTDFESFKLQADEELSRYIEMRRATSPKAHDAEDISENIEGEPTAKMRVLVGSFELDRVDFGAMKPGDILLTDISADSPFRLWVNGESVVCVRPGEVNGKKGVVVE